MKHNYYTIFDTLYNSSSIMLFLLAYIKVYSGDRLIIHKLYVFLLLTQLVAMIIRHSLLFLKMKKDKLIRTKKLMYLMINEILPNWISIFSSFQVCVAEDMIQDGFFGYNSGSMKGLVIFTVITAIYYHRRKKK